MFLSGNGVFTLAFVWGLMNGQSGPDGALFKKFPFTRSPVGGIAPRKLLGACVPNNFIEAMPLGPILHP